MSLIELETKLLVIFSKHLDPIHDNKMQTSLNSKKVPTQFLQIYNCLFFPHDDSPKLKHQVLKDEANKFYNKILYSSYII